jgi:hypothetical protein
MPQRRTRCRCRARSRGRRSPGRPRSARRRIRNARRARRSAPAAAALGRRTRRTFSKVMPVSLPLSCSKALGTRKLRIGMPSCIASSFSQGEAFISSKPERTMTLTSSPPRRRAERQQSIAVLPPPSTITRLPILSMWPNETGQPVDADVDVRAASCGRACRGRAARRAGADEDRVVALGQQRLHRCRCAGRAKLDAEVEDVADLLVDHLLGQAEARDLRAHHAAGLGLAVEHGDS